MGPVPHLPVVALASVGAMLVLSSCGPDRDTAPPPTAASPTASPTVDPRLLPHLSTLTATSISVETDEDGERILRFGTTLANTGAGPVEVIPDPDSPCPEGQRFFAQEVRLDADGDRTYEPDVDTESVRHGGECALFHPDHRHWHIDGSADYELKDTTGTTVASRHKVSYCLRDSRRLKDAVAPTGETYGKCSRDTRQGISPGWGDLYDFDLAGQTLRLPDSLEDGTYCLFMTADPFDFLDESDEDDNASVTAIELTGTKVSRSPSPVCLIATFF